MGRVHVRLDLEDKAGELRVCGVHDASVCQFSRARGRGHVQEVLQERGDPEIRQGGAEEHGRKLACQHRFLVHRISGALQKLHFFPQSLQIELGENFIQPGVVDPGIVQFQRFFLFVQVHLVLQDVVHALEVQAGSDGPGDRRGGHAQDLLQFPDEFQRVTGLPVQLVHEREHRDAPHAAHGEQLLRLGLDTLGRVDDHDGGVHRSEDAVRVFAEVVVTRRIHDGDDFAAVLELHDGAGDGDASLLFDLHPVGRGELAVAAGLDGACLPDGAPVEQQFLGKSGLTGIRVGDDAEDAASLDLFFQFFRIHNR